MRTALALATFLCARSVGAQGVGTTVATLAVAGRSNENVSIAASGQFVAVAWSASTSNATDVFTATSRDGGSSFSTPVRVNATPGDARVGGELPPRVALVTRKAGVPDVVVVWTTKGTAGTRLLVARSTDGARTFGANTVVPGGEGAGNRGWESIAVDSTGRVFVLWLDHRETVMPASMHKHEPAVGAVGAAAQAPKPDPVEKAGKSQLYFSALDGSSARGIARGVCYCCKTSLAAAGTNVYAVWRHVFAGNQRDIGFTISRDGGRTFSDVVRVSDDHWQFDGCPENGPAVAIGRDGRAQVVWPTPVDGKEGSPLGLYHAMSRDGRTFTARTRVPSRGAANHAQVTSAADGSFIVAWDELTDGTRRVALARGQVDAVGKATFTPMHTPEGGPGLYPALATTTAGTVVAWVRRTDAGSTIGVARVR
jgi:hypothetical protein